MLKRCFTVIILLANAVILQSCDSREEKVSTATANVTVLEQTLMIPILNRERKIRIYLPENYQTSKHSFPVLYMHDAQNLFDDATSYAGEWGVDETLNRLAKEKGFSLIVVGVDNGLDLRMNELSPWSNEDYGVAEGEQYMDYIVNVVKPYIDDNYRTLDDNINTAIMGSSMGGLISHYAIFKYPHVFTKAGIFSPSYWYSKKVFEFSDPKKLHANSRLYFIAGANEGDDMVDGMNKMTAQLIKNGLSEKNLYSKTIKGGEHNEHLWRTEFPDAILWLFAED